MIKAIFWNIRGVRSKKAIYRLKNLVGINGVQFVAVFETFISKDKIEGYKRFLGFQHCFANELGHIWCFWSNNLQGNVISSDDQQITINFQDNASDKDITIFAVYAKCTAIESKELWESSLS